MAEGRRRDMTRNEEFILTALTGGAIALVLLWLFNRNKAGIGQAVGQGWPSRYTPSDNPIYAPSAYTLGSPGQAAGQTNPGNSLVFNLDNPILGTPPELFQVGAPGPISLGIGGNTTTQGNGLPGGSGGPCGCPSNSNGPSLQYGSPDTAAIALAPLINYVTQFLPKGIVAPISFMDYYHAPTPLAAAMDALLANNYAATRAASAAMFSPMLG